MILKRHRGGGFCVACEKDRLSINIKGQHFKIREKLN